METGKDVGHEHLVLRTIYSRGFVVAKTTQADVRRPLVKKAHLYNGHGGSLISPASITCSLPVSTFSVTQPL